MALGIVEAVVVLFAIIAVVGGILVGLRMRLDHLRKMALQRQDHEHQMQMLLADQFNELYEAARKGSTLKRIQELTLLHVMRVAESMTPGQAIRTQFDGKEVEIYRRS